MIRMARRPSSTARAPSDPGMTRGQVARRLGVSLATVRRIEASGVLPHRLVDGVHVFAPADVAQLAASEDAPRGRARGRSAGELAAAAFRMLASGRDWRDLVMELEATPDVARQLAADFVGRGREVVIQARDADELRDLGLADASGALTGASILAAVRRLRARAREVRRAEGHPRQLADRLARQEVQQGDLDELG